MKDRLITDCVICEGVTIMPFVNLYGCLLDDDVFVGPFVEIQKGVVVGCRTRIQSHSFICSGVTIGEDCFIAHGVMFTNDKFDAPIEEFIMRETLVDNNVRIGSGATILPGVTIGNNAIIGAGSVVTKDVAPGEIVAGNPARRLR